MGSSRKLRPAGRREVCQVNRGSPALPGNLESAVQRLRSPLGAGEQGVQGAPG